MKLLAAITLGLVDATSCAADIVTYPAPADERQAAPYEVWAGDQQVDIYSARTLDPPFAGKQWDYGGPYCFANFDMAGNVVVKIASSRSLRDTVIRSVRGGCSPRLQDDHTLTIALDKPQKLSIEPDGKKGPLLLFANPHGKGPSRSRRSECHLSTARAFTSRNDRAQQTTRRSIWRAVPWSKPRYWCRERTSAFVDEGFWMGPTGHGEPGRWAI